MTDSAPKVAPIIQAYLAGTEPFDSAATRLATAFRDLEANRPSSPPEPDQLAGRIIWVPLESIPVADRPKVSKLLERAFELLEEHDGEAA